MRNWTSFARARQTLRKPRRGSVRRRTLPSDQYPSDVANERVRQLTAEVAMLQARAAEAEARVELLQAQVSMQQAEMARKEFNLVKAHAMLSAALDQDVALQAIQQTRPDGDDQSRVQRRVQALIAGQPLDYTKLFGEGKDQQDNLGRLARLQLDIHQNRSPRLCMLLPPPSLVRSKRYQVCMRSPSYGLQILEDSRCDCELR